jgi:Family of unknown function (DUF6527)
MKWATLIARWSRRQFERIGPPRRLRVIEGDSLPSRLPPRHVILAREGLENWCVGLRCPCGCGRRIELLLIAEAKPRWDLSVDDKGRPSLAPSVWLKNGCRSHFWLKSGRVRWCD